MVKRYLILFSVTAAVIGLVIYSGTIINAVRSVSVYKTVLSDEERTVSASGRLQYGLRKNISAEEYSLVESVFVSNGDSVKKGDELISVYEYSYDQIPYSSSEFDSIIKLFNSGDFSEEIIETIKSYAHKRIITSDIDGVVSDISCRENEIVTRHSLLMRISDPECLVIEVNINESIIEQIKEDQPVMVRFTAITGKEFKGRVYEISEEARQTSGLTGKETSVEVTVILDEKDERLKIGYSADCHITVSEDKDVLLIPYDCIHSDKKGDYVYVYKDGFAVKKYFTGEDEYGSGISVKKGIEAGDLIISDRAEFSDNERVIIANEG